MRTQAVSSTKAATTPIASSASTMEKQADGVRGRKTCMRAPNSIVNLSECVFSNTSKSEGGFVKVDIMSDDKKELKMEKVVNLVVDDESTVSTESYLDSDESSYYDSDYDSDEDEEEEYDEEVALILEDARKLKFLAQAFLHPEKKVEADPETLGRNYFDRPSAEPTETPEEAEERAMILKDAASLKELAVQYTHPEIGVTKASDAATFGRNYFNRPSADETKSFEEAEEHAQILEDARKLKKLAKAYLHPEVGVSSSDPTSFGRNYFDRPSAVETESFEEAEERAMILADAAALKKLAVQYTHPEVKVVADPTCFGRNYFNRASAEDTETAEEAEERARVLADAAALKKLAVGYLHPEIGVSSSDPASFGRNYFNRASAEDTETYEEAEERAQILADALAMKKLAVQYTHPEIGVNVTDASTFARSYFNRPSAEDTESYEEAEERARVLADARELKKLAVDYCHPEFGVTSSDPTSFGRNYFNRPSAEPTLTPEESGGRAQILADAAALKKLAVDYGHPEIGVTNSDPTTFARNIYKPDAQYVASVNTAPPPPSMQSYYYDESIGHDTASTDLPFDLDEEFDDMHENFMNFQPQHSHVPIDTGMKKHKHREGSDDEEGNLSRSPSSVFLLGLDG